MVWKVFKETRGDSLFIYPGNGTHPIGRTILKTSLGWCDVGWYVHRPNWIERAFGITFKRKLKIAIKKAQRECDKQNARLQRAADFEEYLDILHIGD